MASTILVGLLLVLLCIMVHSAITMFSYNVILWKYQHGSRFKNVIKVDVVVIAILVATMIEGVLWAISYLSIGAFDTFEQALYFSMVTYTTLGYGDLVLADDHRLMGAIEAANGVIMLGWSTAIVVFAIQKVYFSSKN